MKMSDYDMDDESMENADGRDFSFRWIRLKKQSIQCFLMVFTYHVAWNWAHIWSLVFLFWDPLSYKSWTIDWIMVKLMHMIKMDATLKVTKGQGHKVKGQGQICNYPKQLFGL